MKTRLIVGTVLLVVAALITAGANVVRTALVSNDPPVATATKPPAPKTATVADVVGERPVFGVSVADRTPASLARIRQTAGCAPRWVHVYASVADGIDVQALRRSGPGTVPMLTIEPWHSGGGAEQADFTLAATLAGNWDAQYRELAAAVRDYREPVMIRYAPEMNTTSYPWGRVGANTPTQYTQAWRHVVTVFRRAGAANALWVWAPSIRRATEGRAVSTWWPGDRYVDLVGVVGSGTGRATPETTYALPLRRLTALTGKPLILTGTGATGPGQARWIREFGAWLAAHRRVVGFLWNVPADSDDLAPLRRSLDAGRVAC